jgi:hypothetical protein
VNYQAGAVSYFPFTTVNATGAAVNADSTPTGTLYVNGTADAAIVTVSNNATGAYTASVMIPAGASVGDDVAMLIAATVGGITSRAWIGRGYVDATISSVYALADTTNTRALLALPAFAPGTEEGLPVLNGDNEVTALVARIQTGAITTDALSEGASAEIASAVWAAATRTLTTISDSSGVTTLLSRLTATRADKLDDVAQVGSPMFLADGSIDEPVVAQEVYDAIAAAAAGSVAATTVVRGGLKLIVDADPTGTGESFETIYIGSRPTLRVNVLDRQGKPVPIAASHTATFTDLVTGTEIASVAGTRRGDDTGITDIIVPAACTASAMRLNLTLEWINGSGMTEIAGGTVVEVQAQ